MGIDVLDESVFHKFNYQNKEAGTKLFFKHDAQCYYEFTPSTTTKVLKVFFAPKWDKHKNTIYTYRGLCIFSKEREMQLALLLLR